MDFWYNKFMALWYDKTYPKIREILESSDSGLSTKEAVLRLEQYGKNQLPEKKPDTVFKIFLSQFQSPLIYILIAAAIVVIIVGEIIDAAVIWAVLIFNAFVGTIQEGKAQNTLRALKKLIETKAIVLRNGEELIISDNEVVPGDILILKEGQKISADGRIFESNNLTINESMLTGESGPVQKTSDIIDKENVPVSDQINMVFRGTSILSGNGKSIVTETGVDTIVGKISEKIVSIDTEIPLKTNIKYLSRAIIIVVAAISVIIFSIGMVYGHSVKDMFLTVVTLSVSIIPEGLPIVLTLVLATGVWRMTKRNALVKHLQAVEALGQARVIALDKTGTLTKNEMVIREVFVDNCLFEVGGDGYESKGAIAFNRQIANPKDYPGLLMLGKSAALCANAMPMYSEETGLWQVDGDPTEAALMVFSKKAGFDKIELEKVCTPLGDIPFSYQTKYHAVVRKEGNKKILIVTGAPEVIMSLSKKIWLGGKYVSLTPKNRLVLDSMFWTMSRKGLRVIATAISYAPPKELIPENIEDLTFLGFYGVQDALRPEAFAAVQAAESAGIKTLMITGDHVLTTEAIAKQAGIYHDGDAILTGNEIDNLSDDELVQKLENTTVFARVTPEHKLKIIEAFKKRGDIIAMTGDGVNDAPSLVAADLGVAMGKIGTEVAKEAADIILLDDNFGSIIAAVEEGRGIYKTIKKVILYLFSTSLGEAFTITAALLVGFPLPILPAQIIWLNFVTDGFLDVSLAMEPKEKGLLKEKLKRPSIYIVDSLMFWRMFVMATPMVIGTLFLFNQYFRSDIMHAWTVSLTVLAVFQWLNAWNCRSEKESLFKMNLFSNKFLVYATLIIISLQMFAIYTPTMQKILRTVPLTLNDWLKIIAISLSIVFFEEIRKFFYRKRAVVL